MYFNKNTDGSFQSIGHWDNSDEVIPAYFTEVEEGEEIPLPNEQPLWKKASVTSLQANDDDPIFTHKVTIENWSDFYNPQFSLIKGAFVINTSGFGNGDGDDDYDGVTYTVTGEGSDESGEIYNTGDNGDIGETIAPEDMTENHYMNINGDVFNLPGKIMFQTDGNGNILADAVFFEYEENFYPLSPELYSIVQAGEGVEGDVLVLNSEPVSSEGDCSNDISISFSENDPLILKENEFSITGISFEDENLNFKVYTDPDNPIVNLSNYSEITAWNGTEVLASGTGVYQFELTLTTTDGASLQPYTFKGQLMVTE